MRNKTENNTPVDPKINANNFPFSSSIVFQTTTIVRAPKSAGKNFTQKTELPSLIIMKEIKAVTGGTDE